MMADSKLSALAALAVEMADIDEIYINDGGVSKRQTYAVFKAAFADLVSAQTIAGVKTFSDNIKIGVSGKGIDFSATADATGMTSELFDDYEEVDHAASVTCATSGGYNLAAGESTLAATKSGRKAHLEGRLHITSASSPSGQLRVSLPYTAASLTGTAGKALTRITIWHHGGTIVNPVADIRPAKAYLTLFDVTDAGGLSGTTNASVDTDFYIDINLTYVVA